MAFYNSPTSPNAARPSPIVHCTKPTDPGPAASLLAPPPLLDPTVLTADVPEARLTLAADEADATRELAAPMTLVALARREERSKRLVVEERSKRLVEVVVRDVVVRRIVDDSSVGTGTLAVTPAPRLAQQPAPRHVRPLEQHCAPSAGR